MKHQKITTLAFILLTALLSCDEKDKSLNRVVTVEIYESTIPTNGAIDQDIQLQLRAQANNGCYSNLEINLKELDGKHFLLEATARYQSNGVCPEVMVYEDTVITFKPTSAGEYFFQVNEEPFEVRNHQITIN